MSDNFLVPLLTRLCHLIDQTNLWVGRTVSRLAVLLVLVVFGNVVLRYLFHASFVFLHELEWHLFALLFLLGGGYTLLKEGHVRVDIVYQRLGARSRAWINLAGVLLLLLPGCWLVIATGVPFAVSSFRMGEGSPDPGGIQFRFVLKSIISLAFLLIGLQGVSLGLKSVLLLRGCPLEQKNCRNPEEAAGDVC